LGHYDTVSQVRTYVNGMTNLSTYNYFIDTGGEAALWENQTGVGQHWEYNTRAKARDSQWIDADNADGLRLLDRRRCNPLRLGGASQHTRTFQQ
jgi:hypothetical protein